MNDEANEQPQETKDSLEHEVTAKPNQRIKNQPQKRLYSGVTSVTIKTTELQRRPTRSPRHIRQAAHRPTSLRKNGHVLSSVPVQSGISQIYIYYFAKKPRKIRDFDHHRKY